MDENITNGLILMITNSYEVVRNGKISPLELNGILTKLTSKWTYFEIITKKRENIISRNGLILTIWNSRQVDRIQKIRPFTGWFWPFYWESGFIL